MSDEQKKTLSVREIAKKCGVTTTQIQRLARKGQVPGAELKKADGYHTAYHDTQELRQWIKDRRSRKKGRLPDGKRKAKEKSDLSATSFPDRSLRKWKASLGKVDSIDPLEDWENLDLLTLSRRLEVAVDIYSEIEFILHGRLAHDIHLERSLTRDQNKFEPFSPEFQSLKEFLWKLIRRNVMRGEEEIMPVGREWSEFFNGARLKHKAPR